MNNYQAGRAAGNIARIVTEQKIERKKQHLIERNERKLRYCGEMWHLTLFFVVLLIAIGGALFTLNYMGLVDFSRQEIRLLQRVGLACAVVCFVYIIWFIYLMTYLVEVEENQVVYHHFFHKRVITFEELREAAKRKPVRNNGVNYYFPTARRDLRINISQTYIGDYIAEMIATEAGIKDFHGGMSKAKVETRVNVKLIIVLGLMTVGVIAYAFHYGDRLKQRVLVDENEYYLQDSLKSFLDDWEIDASKSVVKAGQEIAPDLRKTYQVALRSREDDLGMYVTVVNTSDEKRTVEKCTVQSICFDGKKATVPASVSMNNKSVLWGYSLAYAKSIYGTPISEETKGDDTILTYDDKVFISKVKLWFMNRTGLYKVEVL